MNPEKLSWLERIESSVMVHGGTLPVSVFDPQWARLNEADELDPKELMARFVLDQRMWPRDTSPLACARCSLIANPHPMPPLVALLESAGDPRAVELATSAAWTEGVMSGGWLGESSWDDWRTLCHSLLRCQCWGDRAVEEMTEWLLRPAIQQRQQHFLWDPRAFSSHSRYADWPSFAIYLSAGSSSVTSPWRRFDGAHYLLRQGHALDAFTRPMVHWLREGINGGLPYNPTVSGSIWPRPLREADIRHAQDEMRFGAFLARRSPGKHRVGEMPAVNPGPSGIAHHRATEDLAHAARPDSLVAVRALSDHLRRLGAVRIPEPAADVAVNHSALDKASPHAPEVSIVVPCFRQGHFLRELLESVSLSCSANHEVVIVDDASPEGGVPADLEPSSANQSLRIVTHLSNHGLGQARATGVRFSVSPFIQFLDADDLLMPDQLSSRLTVAREDRVQVVLGEYYLSDSGVGSFELSDTVGRSRHDLLSIASEWEHNLSIPIHCALFETELVRSTPFDKRLRSKEDWDFWLRLFSKGPSVSYRDEAVAVYRMHSAAMTKSSIIRGAISYAEVLRRASDLLIKSGIPHSDLILAGQARHYAAYYSDRLEEDLGTLWSSLLLEAHALGT